MLFSLLKERNSLIYHVAIFTIFFIFMGIAFSILYILFPGQEWSEELLFFGAFLFCLLLIYHFIPYYFSSTTNFLKMQNELLSLLVLRDQEFYLILDNNDEIVMVSENFRIAINEASNNLTIDNLDRTINFLQLSSIVAKQLKTAYEHGEDIRIKTSIILSNMPLEVILKLYFVENRLERYAVIQARKDDPYAMIEDIYDKFNFGYFELDEFYHIVKCNEFFARTLGYSRAELLENYFDIKELLLEDDKQQIDSEAIKQNWQKVLVFKTKQRELLNAIVITKAYYSQFGTIERIAGYMLKLTDNNLMIKAQDVEKGWLEYSWQCFFANSPYPVAIVDLFGKIIKINTSAGKIVNSLGMPFLSLFIEEDAKKVELEMKKLIANPNAEVTPMNALHLLGSKKVVDVYLGNILNLSESHHGFIVRFSDVTQQLEIERQLSHGQRMQTIGNLAGSIAHDFNNLLTAILGFCDLLLLRHTPGDPSFADIMQIRQSTNRASSLVSRLLAFSRRQTLKGQTLNLNEFFGDFYAIIRRLVGGEIEVEQIIPPDLWYIKVDLVQFEQVILNLVVNAHQALNNNGSIKVKAYNLELSSNSKLLQEFMLPKGESQAPYDKYVAIEIEDNGRGIPIEILDRIFEPFFTTKDALSGTGLGLSTVYGIIKQSGGYIYIRTQVGLGTTFLLLFPQYIPTDKEIEMLNSVEEHTISTYQPEDKSGVIVLVEDEEAVRTFAKQALSNKGYEVLDFESPIAALDHLESNQEKIKLIISDVVMPQMSGPSFVEKIKEKNENLKVIFISGYGEDAFTKTYGDAREFNFLPKPFSLKALLAKVKEVSANNTQSHF